MSSFEAMDGFLLQVEWAQRLCASQFGDRQRGTSGDGTYNMTTEDGEQLHFRPSKPGVVIDGPKDKGTALRRIERESRKLGAARDAGGGVWWQLAYRGDLGFEMTYSLHFMRVMNEQRRFDGYFRFTPSAFVKFELDEAWRKQALSPPKFEATVTFWVPSPGYGPFGSSLAEDLGQRVRAVISFLTGIPVDPPPVFFPPKPEQVDEARAEGAKASVDLASELGRLGYYVLSPGRLPANEALSRYLGALLAYEQAIYQRSDHLVVALMVSAIEALSSPEAAWGKLRVTARFKAFVEEAAGETLDEVLAHGNCAEAFPRAKSRRRLLDDLYEMRSVPLHTGLMGHRVTQLPGFETGLTARVMLTSILARATVKAFSERPFTSLVGHPSLDPASEAAKP
jgi:hypothetical protein